MPATYEALSQGGHEAMATEIFTKIKDYLDTHGADSKVSKAGDTMTGVLSMKDEAIDASKSNNNVSSTRYPTTFNILDNASRIISRMECVVESNGNISSYWYTRNYNTSGGQVAQKGIKMTMNKSGGLSYSVSDGENFATAIGKYVRSSIGTLDWAATNQQLLITKSALAYWNGCYVGTASNLQYCNRGAFGTIVTKNSGDYLPYGATQKAASGSGKTVNAGVILDCCSIAITAGTWIVTYSASFPSGASNKSTCGCLVSTAAGSSSPVCHGALVNEYYTNVNENRNGNAFLYQASGNVTLHLGLWARGSGNITNCAGEIRAFRIG